MQFKKKYLILIIILVYFVFLGFNISYHKLSEYDSGQQNEYGYWELYLLGDNFCGAPSLRFGMTSVGTTFKPDDKILASRCGVFDRMILSEAQYSDSDMADPIPYYNIYCQGISFEKSICVQ